MQLLRVKKLTGLELKQIALLHSSALRESFLNKFGYEFLFAMYHSLCKSDNCVFVVAKDKKQIIGFAVLIKNHEQFIKDVVTDPSILKAALSKPVIIVQAVFGIFTKRPPSMAELQFIAVRENFRSRGIGREMIRKLNVNQFIVGTKKHNARSNNFYRKLKYRFIGIFSVFNEELNYYLARYL